VPFQSEREVPFTASNAESEKMGEGTPL